MEQTVRALIMRHEGIRLHPYKDTVGVLSVGVGRNLESVGIRYDEAMLMLDNDITEAYDALMKYPWFPKLSESRKAACLDLMFNLGAARFSGFRKFIGAMSIQNYDTAAYELVHSDWYAQVKGRGLEIFNLIKTGTWPE